MADEDKVTRLLKRWKDASTTKSQWHGLWDDLARVMLPSRLGFTATVVEGHRRTDDIFDGTPMQAARGLANSVGGMMRPQGLPEIKMKAEDDALNASAEAQAWMHDCEQKLKNGFNNPKARFRQASGEVDLDLVVLGNAVMFIGEGLRRNHLLFQSVHLRDATPVFSEEGAPEGLFRHRRMPVRHLVDRFGPDKLSQSTKEKIKDKPEEKIEILHAILPRAGGRADPLFAKNLPFADMWIEIAAKHEITAGGFHEFPFVFPRWDTSSGEDFARSPGMIALPDADTLQAMGETILIAGQRAADPPLAVPNDGTFSALNTFPGGLSYYDVESAVAVRGNPFFTIPSGTSLPISRDMQADTRQQIFAAFFRNVLNLPVQGPEMTAYEVNQRKEEFIREIGPVFGKLESDYTAPMVERAFMIMLRAGAFLPIPEVLQGANVTFEYDSPVKRIRQQIEAASARLWALEMIEIGQVKPEAIDLINVDALGRFTAEAAGVPKDVVNSAETVMQLRAQREEAQAQAREAMALEQAASIAKTGAEAASTAGLIEQQPKAA